MREIKFRAWHRHLNRMLESKDWHHYGPHLIGGSLESDDHILMQYTGLKDKNGKEIYEGDILSKEPFLKVVFENGGFCFSNDLASGSDRISQDRVSRLHVIGNIHENQELL